MPRASSNPRKVRKLSRLEARITPQQKQLIERAAAIRGTSVTEFVIASAQESATRLLQEFDSLELRDAARDRFIEAVLHPPAPNDAARAAAARYKRSLGL
ncbi:MAG TPA: DUF1778 domain-containing protein [Candidatus Acidoferrales bacterium]|nr:DUF1778 domain-containing protein [Candidatus Acidoferrales bacterium]